MTAQVARLEQRAHLSAQIQPVQAEFSLTAESLPYEKLGGPGFERLCYLLLLTRGHSPLFFGTSGQAQRGIDLLVEEDGERVVYQCKNVKNFSVLDMIAALDQFELEWLQTSDLPRPNKFVLCMSKALRDVKEVETWEKYCAKFAQKHGIEIGVPWDRKHLDETLKQLPDIVAEIFSDQIARFFCNRDDWEFDQFHPVTATATEHSLKRYFARKTSDRLYVDPQLVADFTEKLESNGSVLVEGLPGSGKTVTSLALAEELTEYRVYYVSLREAISNDTLIKGIKDRLSRRTIFILDDCQGKFVELNYLMNRIRRLLQGPPTNQTLFVFVSRITPTPEDLARGDVITDFEDNLRQAEAVLRFAPDAETFRQIIQQDRPEFANLTSARLTRLYEFTGRDLFLLDHLIDTLDDLEDLDELNLKFLFRKTIARYFDSEAVNRPGFMHLAALAQFDLAPEVAKFPYDLKTEDPQAMIELVAEAGYPLHYFFLHSSAAELIFRSLAMNHGITDHIGNVAKHLIDFFKNRESDESTLASDLSKVMQNGLKLSSKAQVEELKSIFLADHGIYELIERNFAMLPLNVLAACRTILRNTESTELQHYEELIRRKVEDGAVLQLATTRPFWECNLFFRSTKRVDPQLLDVLRNQFAATATAHRQLSQTTDLSTFVALLSIVAEPEDTRWEDLLNQISDEEVEMMFARTMAAGNSIGSFRLALRELKTIDKALLRNLEKKIGAPRFMRLIAANGTFAELFKVSRYSTPELADEMIAAIDDQLVEQLIERTITTRRSIGTLGLALRELKRDDTGALPRLEKKIGAPRFLRLIAANGTIFELLRVIQYSTLEFARAMVAALDDLVVEELITRTITSGRSVATLDLTLREFKESDEVLLHSLEDKIGATRFLRLIAANGTIFELLMTIKHSSLQLANNMIVELDDALIEQLIERTITTGRSIGTLDLALRELKKYDTEALRRLEKKIGVSRFLRLISPNGSIPELFRVLHHSSRQMAEEIIAALDDQIVDQLINRSITSGNSIGTLHLTLRYLKRVDHALLDKLNAKIGINRWWRLVRSFGSVAILKQLLPAMDKSLQQQFMTVVQKASLDEWKELLRQNGFYELSYLIRNLPSFFSKSFRPDFLRPLLVSSIQSSNWETRYRACANLSHAQDSIGKHFLLKLLHEQVTDIEPGALEFSSFSEAANAVSLLWRLQPTKRTELTERMRRFIANGTPIYRDSAYLRSARGLFSTLATPEATIVDSQIVLTIGNDDRVAKLFDEAATLDLFLYVWNLFALWVKCTSSAKALFYDFLNVQLREALIHTFLRRLSDKDERKEIATLVRLAGVMSYVGAGCEHSRVTEKFSLDKSSAEEIISALDHKDTFIPSVFLLVGLEWILDDGRFVPRQLWHQQIAKARKYAEQTAALEHLVSFTTAKSRLS